MHLDGITLDVLQQRFVIGLLFFARVTALMQSGAFFNNPAIQPQIKIVLSALLAMLMTTSFGAEQPPIDVHLWTLVPLVFKEVLVGLILGFSSNILFYAVRFAGGITDFDMGFQTALLFNPDADVPTLVGEIQALAALMIFLILNGHHFLIESIYASVKAVPLTTFALGEHSITLLVRLLTMMLIIGMKISAPILVALFLTNLSLALLSRVAPQMNVFALSFQFKIIVGILVLMFSAPLLVIVVKNALTMFENDSMELLISLRRGT